jgi:restriction endonuclease
MIRLDFAGWSRSVSASAIKSKCDKVSAFVLYRSIVDMSKVSLNDFISVYQDTVRAENKDIDAAGVIKKCQDLYFVFNPSKRPVNAVEASAPLLMGNEVEQFVPTKGYQNFDVFSKNLTTL